MAKLLSSFYEYTKDPAPTYPKDQPGQSFLFSLAGSSWNQAAPGHCLCTGGNCVSPAGYDSDIPMHIWCVPAGISQVTFQLWGAGGWGAGSYHCQQGVSGGSGAFAQKTVSATPGDRYVLCLGDMLQIGTQTKYGCAAPQATGCAYTDISHGVRGPKAYVNGPGLTNFCAEGGNPGVVRGHGWICSSNIGGGTTQMLCYENLRTCDLVGNTNDSDNNLYHRACYYGADFGARGNHGYVQANCCSNFCGGGAPWCGAHWHRPFTGMQPDFAYGWPGTLHGGWVKEYHCAIVAGPIDGKMNRGLNSKTPYMGSLAWSNHPKKWGAGGVSATTCGGTVCCGGPGGPNAIRVIYK